MYAIAHLTFMAAVALAGWFVHRSIRRTPHRDAAYRRSCAADARAARAELAAAAARKIVADVESSVYGAGLNRRAQRLQERARMDPGRTAGALFRAIRLGAAAAEE